MSSLDTSCALICRDLKSGNLLVTNDYVVKLADFGSAKIMRSDSSTLQTSSPDTKSSFSGTASMVSATHTRQDGSKAP